MPYLALAFENGLNLKIRYLIIRNMMNDVASPAHNEAAASEEDSAFLPTFYSYMWMSPLLARGWALHKADKPMTIEDVLRLPDAENIHDNFAAFRTEWASRVAAWEDQCKINPLLRERPPSLFMALAHPNAKHFIIAGLCRFVADGLSIATPFILREFIAWLVRFVRRRSTAQDGWIWAVALALAQLLGAITSNISYFHSIRAFAKMRVACLMALFDKSMDLESTHDLAGLIVQMHTTDTLKFLEFGIYFFQIFTGPMSIIAALIGLYYFIGWAGVLSIVIIIIVMPFQTFVVSKLFGHRSSGARIKDSRLQAINEVLSGIRIVKFMNWEKQFAKRIAEIRNEELANLRWLYFFRSWMIIISNAQPFLVSFAVFVIAYGFGSEISAESIFPTTAMLTVIRMPLIFLPLGIGKAVDVNVTLERIRIFLLRPERRRYLVASSDTSGDVAIEMKDVSVVIKEPSIEKTKEKEPLATPLSQFLMANINLKLLKGKLIAVVGPTGSGKSTLLSAMIGECTVDSQSSVHVFGSRAYMAQQAWITNATVRDNILMGLPYDHDRYLETVNVCQLIPDLAELPASDETEIGERGVNLSGGQKQRVAFARAVYSNRDTIIMDDPLSAVDSHVCLALFEECILGALQGRTRVLVTHQVQFLPRCDVVVVLDRCGIVFQGTHEEMVRSEVDVAALIAHASPESTMHRDPTAYEDEASPTAADVETPTTGAPSKHAKAIPAPRAASQQQLMVSEHLEQGYFSVSTVAWYYSKQGWPLVICYLSGYTLWRTAQAAADLIVSWWSSRTPVLNNQLTSLQYIQWYGTFIGITIALLLIRQFPLARAFLRAATISHDGMVNRILHAPTSFFDTTPMGRIVSRFSKDIEELDNQMPEKMNFFLGLVFSLLGLFAIMCYGAPYLSIIIVLFLCVFAVTFRYYSATNRAQKRLEAMYISPVVSTMGESATGLATIRAYDAVPTFLAKHNAAVHNMARTEYSWRVSQRWVGIRTDVLSSVIVAATTLLTVGLMTSYDRSTQSDLLPIMALGVTYSLNIGLTIGFLTSMTADVEASFSSIERVKEFTETVPQEREVMYSSEESSSVIDPPPPSWPSQGELVFRNVSLRYRENLPLVLNNISMTVPHGSKVGIVGRTGSGKSTMLLALFRMVELASGSIILDGRDIADLKLDDLRSKITIIPQDPLLFKGTIRSNVDPFMLSTAEEVWSVLGRVGLRERIEKDSLGLDGAVANNGSNFSVGQRQLLCLARALLKRCKLLLLDEATASVDFECDAMIQQTVRREFSSCTVLTIAHRLATVVDSDLVCVLDHGVVVEYDSPAALLRREESVFTQMVRKLGDEQFKILKAAAER
jgi:ABC-type multidrug transport system fused ATPase/permease subunit